MSGVDLLARIGRALAEPGLDPGEFERCAVALLQSVYPGLSAVEGGHDFGRDADIYFPLDTAAAGLPRRGRLLATTGDARANVVRGLARMREQGLSVDLLVVAASRPLSARQRRSIEQLAAEHGVGDTQFYTRDWFLGRLVKEPVWRRRLLGIGGQLGALVAGPIALLQQPSPGAELVGRQDVLRSLGDLVEQGRDLVLVGPPGVGRTRVCAELGEGVLFVEPADEGRLLDDLRELEPRVVVVDDAHDRARELTVLRRARVEEGLRLFIVAVTWSDRADAVESVVPGATSVVLPLLERAEIDTLIQAQGVRGYRARRLVLGQSQGRPGWALALSAVLLRGDADEVLSGAALLTPGPGIRAAQRAVTGRRGSACLPGRVDVAHRRRRSRVGRAVRSRPRRGQRPAAAFGHQRPARPGTPQDLLESLLGQRGPMLEALAPVLYARGVPAADLAAAAGGQVGWAAGSESGGHRAILDYFQRLLEYNDPALRAVAEAGIRQQRNHLAAVLANEHEGRVSGYLWAAVRRVQFVSRQHGLIGDDLGPAYERRTIRPDHPRHGQA